MIILGSDHSGFKYRKAIAEHLIQHGYEVNDLGQFSDEPSDYPDIVKKVCTEVLKEKAQAILVCGTGIGVSIAANRFKGIRAANVSNAYDARMSKEHNDANILCLGERTLGLHAALDLVDVWLNAKFTGEERHVRRIGKIDEV